MTERPTSGEDTDISFRSAGDMNCQFDNGTLPLIWFLLMNQENFANDI
jgi:hypothetical protein